MSSKKLIDIGFLLFVRLFGMEMEYDIGFQFSFLLTSAPEQLKPYNVAEDNLKFSCKFPYSEPIEPIEPIQWFLFSSPTQKTVRLLENNKQINFD